MPAKPEQPEDLCPRLEPPPIQSTQPMATPIYPAAVYRCEDPRQAASLLDHQTAGYVYSRDAHPNADILAEKLRQLHAADAAIVCGSGMASLALAALSLLRHGDHVVISSRLYGQSQNLLANELGRLGVNHTLVDTCDLAATAGAFTPSTRLVVAETITNPLVRVTDVRGLAKITHDHGAWLLMDNSFAGPTVCRPLALGADLVVESLTKIINGHSDVMLGLLCGRSELWERVPATASAWGFFASPFDCWLAARDSARWPSAQKRPAPMPSAWRST